MATQTVTASGVALTGLITPTEYYERANLTSPSNATQIQQAIYDATADIMESTGRWFVDAGAAMTDILLFSGGNQKDLFPKQGPILSLTTIELWNGTEWETIDSAVYDQLTDGNKIWFRSGSRWVTGTENWRVTYTFGFKGGIPDDLKRACYELARHYISQRSDNLKSESDGEQAYSYFESSSLPSDVDKIINRYKRYETIG